MNLRFDHDEVAGAVSEALLGYCNDALFRIVTQDAGFVSAQRYRSRSFNARVETVDGASYTALLYDGVVSTLTTVINSLDSETVDDEVVEFSKVLLGGPEHTNLMYRSLAYCTIYFVMLHEASHVTCGHFEYARHRSLQPGGGQAFSLSEIGDEPPITVPADQIEENFTRLCELEADAIALDLMLALSLELLAANSELETDLIRQTAADEKLCGVRQKAGELMFHAACLGVALIEVRRGVTAGYPRPFSRIFNLADLYFQKFMPISDETRKRPDGALEVVLDETSRSRLQKFGIPAFFAAMDLADVAAKTLGYELEARLGLTAGEGSVSKRLTEDFLAVLRGSPAEMLTTEEAREVVRLRGLRGVFRERLEAYRPSLTYRRATPPIGCEVDGGADA